MPLLPTRLWSEREPREKILLGGLLIFLVTTIFYLLVYQPIQDRYTQAHINYQQSNKDYRWLHGQIATIANLKRTARGADLAMEGIGKLRTEIDQSLKKYKLTANIAILDKEEDGKLIEIKIDSANGREVLKWLEQNMQRGHLLHALNLNHKGNGRVSTVAYFELKRNKN